MDPRIRGRSGSRGRSRSPRRSASRSSQYMKEFYDDHPGHSAEAKGKAMGKGKGIWSRKTWPREQKEEEQEQEDGGTVQDQTMNTTIGLRSVDTITGVLANSVANPDLVFLGHPDP